MGNVRQQLFEGLKKHEAKADEPEIDGPDMGEVDPVDPTEEFEQELLELIMRGTEGWKARTYSDVGMMTKNRGLVITYKGRNYQLTIVPGRGR